MNRSAYYMVAALLLLSACQRKTGDTTTLNITFPGNPTGAKLNAKVVSGNVSIKSNFSSTTPSSIADFSCFGITIGGPEPELNRDVCGNADGTNKTVFGIMAGLVGAGTSLTLDVPSGNDRVIRVFGMKRVNGSIACPEVHNMSDYAQTNLSAPYILGETSGIQMPAGGEVSVSINASFDATKSFTDCQGPDVGSGGNGQNSGNILITGFDRITTGLCARYDIQLMNPTPDPATKQVLVSLTDSLGAPVSSGGVSGSLGCAGATTGTLAIALDASNKGVFYATSGSIYNSAQVSVVATPTLTGIDGHNSKFVSIESGSFAPPTGSVLIDGPVAIPTNTCVPYKLTYTSSSGAVAQLSSASIQLELSLGTTGISGGIYSEPSCGTLFTDTNSNGKPDYTVNTSDFNKTIFLKVSNNTEGELSISYGSLGVMGNYLINPVPWFDHIAWQGPVSNLLFGDCTPITFQAETSGSAPISGSLANWVPFRADANLPYNVIQWSSNSNCTDNVSGQLQLSPSGTSTYYARIFGGGTYSMTIGAPRAHFPTTVGVTSANLDTNGLAGLWTPRNISGSLGMSISNWFASYATLGGSTGVNMVSMGTTNVNYFNYNPSQPYLDFTGSGGFNVMSGFNLTTAAEPVSVIAKVKLAAPLGSLGTVFELYESGGQALKYNSSGVATFAGVPIGNLPLGTWITLAYVRDNSLSNDRHRIYLNGVLLSTISSTTLAASSGFSAHSGLGYSFAGNGDYMNGRSQGVVVYNRALSASDLGQVFNFFGQMGAP